MGSQPISHGSPAQQAQAQRFAGKVAIVTGAAGGLGRELASAFAAEGALVLAADLQAPTFPTPGARDEADCVGVQLDVTSQASWEALLARVRREQSRLDILVNCAGVAHRESIRSIGLPDWQRVIDVNLTGPMLGIHCSAPLMRDSGGGAVVNIGSTAGVSAHPGVAYCASKWGLRGVTVSAALELLDWGIRVNAVHPVQIQGTGITAGATAGWRYAQEHALPMRRGITAQEVARAVLFLASEAASYITGTDLPLDGGAMSTGLARVRTVLQHEFDKTQGERDR